MFKTLQDIGGVEDEAKKLDKASQGMERALENGRKATSDLADLASDLLEERVKDLEKSKRRAILSLNLNRIGAFCCAGSIT